MTIRPTISGVPPRGLSVARASSASNAELLRDAVTSGHQCSWAYVSVRPASSRAWTSFLLPSYGASHRLAIIVAQKGGRQ